MIRRGATVAGVVAGLLFIGGAPAAAHVALTSSDPPVNATLFTPPPTVTLTFNEDIASTFASVVVESAGQTNWVIAGPQIYPRQLRTLLKPAVPAGTYTVNYRVVSADGHPVTGSFAFTVARLAASAPPQAAAPRADLTTIAADSTSTRSSDSNYLEWIGAGAAAIALLIVGARLRIIERRENS